MRITATTRSARGKLGGPSTATAASIPAPVEGWDAISPVAEMSPKRAVRMINWFPQPDWIEIRKGFAKHSDTGTGFPVETLPVYHGLTTDKLFAVSDGTIFDVTNPVPATATTQTGLANSRFQYLNFATTGGLFLYMVNGADEPRYFDGTDWNIAAITGVASSDIVYVNAFKNRLWFALNNSSDAYYLDVDSIQGAAVLFPLGGLFTWGGYLMAIGTWSVDAGNGPTDYIVFYSSRGQVAIYSGTDPSADFQLTGTFNLGSPIGRRCMTKVGADIALISIDGVVPLSKAMIFERAAVPKVTLTERIQRVMNESARLYQDNFGWQLISYPRGTRAILNVPIEENSQQQQYVMNTLSGAWCQFTNMNANCWELLLDNPYFGGNDGVVYQADIGNSDSVGVLQADMMTAFNYLGGRDLQKRFMMCRPNVTTDQQVNPGIAFNVDFQSDAPISTQSTTPLSGGLWDVAIWDQGIWGGGSLQQLNWTSATGVGYSVSVRMTVNINPPTASENTLWGDATWGDGFWGGVTVGDAIILQINGFNVTYERGAIL